MPSRPPRTHRLYAIARRILRDGYAAEDAVQETLVRAWRELRSLRDLDRFDAWLHRLLVNACKDQVRRLRRRPFEVPVLTIDQPSVEDQLGQLVDRDELERAFLRALGRAARGARADPLRRPVGGRGRRDPRASRSARCTRACTTGRARCATPSPARPSGRPRARRRRDERRTRPDPRRLAPVDGPDHAAAATASSVRWRPRAGPTSGRAGHYPRPGSRRPAAASTAPRLAVSRRRRPRRSSPRHWASWPAKGWSAAHSAAFGRPPVAVSVAVAVAIAVSLPNRHAGRQLRDPAMAPLLRAGRPTRRSPPQPHSPTRRARRSRPT